VGSDAAVVAWASEIFGVKTSSSTTEEEATVPRFWFNCVLSELKELEVPDFPPPPQDANTMQADNKKAKHIVVFNFNLLISIIKRTRTIDNKFPKVNN
jgi:hypothetical protein